jgi:hypothetical protein
MQRYILSNYCGSGVAANGSTGIEPRISAAPSRLNGRWRGERG